MASVSLPFASALPTTIPSSLNKRTLSFEEAFASTEYGFYHISDYIDPCRIVTFTPFTELDLSKLMRRSSVLDSRAQGSIGSDLIAPRSDIDAAMGL